ncbi:MAG: DUF5661 family protein [bacterium]
MKMPEYITTKEVRRVCRELKIRDWTKLKKAEVTMHEARTIYNTLRARAMGAELDQFKKGLEVELEHGLLLGDTNVTNNHPILTGKIVLAHFKESLDYYRRLEVAELEGDLLKAIHRNDAKKARNYYRRIAEARMTLSKAEAKKLSKER